MTADALGPWQGLTLAGGRYRKLETIGVGGMGYVYRAVDGNLQTHVVIKAPRLSIVEDPQQIKRFEREIRALVKLSFPHIVPVIDVGRHDGQPYAVMRYLTGGNLAARIPIGPDGRPRPMAWTSVPKWLPPIAKALDFIHSSGYVHRDVKPANVLFDQQDQAYLSDFGLIRAAGDVAKDNPAKAGGEVFLFGTADYMAPELLAGRPFDGRADQYALAVSVYETLSGAPPFAGGTIASVTNAHLTRTPPRLAERVRDVPQSISSAVVRALSKQPEDRFATCSDFVRAMAIGLRPDSASLPQLPPVGTPAASGAANRTPNDRPTHRLPTPPAPPVLLAQVVDSTSSRSRLIAVVAAVVVAAVTIGGAFALMRSDGSGDDAATTANPLPRLLAQWRDRFKDVESSITVDSEPIRKSPAYADAAGFEALLAEAAGAKQAAAQKSLGDLEAELTAMATIHRERTEAAGTAPRRTGGDDAAEQRAAAEQRDLRDQEAQIVECATRLKSLRLTVQSPRGLYDPEAVAELGILREMETVAATNTAPDVRPETSKRAQGLINVRNPALSFRALNVLARSGDADGIETAVSRLDLVPLDRQSELIWSLLVSGHPDAIAAAAKHVVKQPLSLEKLDRAAFATLAAAAPVKYQSLLSTFVDLCRSSDERFRLFQAQADVLTDAGVEEVVASCRAGLLQERVVDVVAEVVTRRPAAALPLLAKLLHDHRRLKLETLSGEELSALAEAAPESAGLLGEMWILHGTPSQRDSALALFARSEAILPADRLFARADSEGIDDAVTLVNKLLPAESDRSVRLAEYVLTHVPNLNAETVRYATASGGLLKTPAARETLFRVAWQDEEAGRAWVLQQLLGADFTKRLAEAERDRDRQVEILQAVSPVLNGTLVKLSGTFGTGQSAVGLEVPSRDVLRLRASVDSAAWKPDSAARQRLSELKKTIDEAKKSTVDPYSATLDVLARYVDQLRQLTETCFQISEVYDLTIGLQLPGALRELKVSLAQSWEFRFHNKHVDMFREEEGKFQMLATSLRNLRSQIPLPE